MNTHQDVITYRGHTIETPLVKKGSDYCNIFIDGQQMTRIIENNGRQGKIPVRHRAWNAENAAKKIVDRIEHTK